MTSNRNRIDHPQFVITVDNSNLERNNATVLNLFKRVNVRYHLEEFKYRLNFRIYRKYAMQWIERQTVMLKGRWIKIGWLLALSGSSFIYLFSKFQPLLAAGIGGRKKNPQFHVELSQLWYVIGGNWCWNAFTIIVSNIECKCKCEQMNALESPASPSILPPQHIPNK